LGELELCFVFTYYSYLFFAVLEVQARDFGTPLLSTSVLVNILIEDANDNPPLFPEGNYTVFVQEDKPYGHILLTFSVTDADDTPNGVPFSW
jgi:protocadherin Fat 1/2/3